MTQVMLRKTYSLSSSWASCLENTYTGGSSLLFALQYNFLPVKMSHGYMYV